MGKIKGISNFPICRPILDIYGHSLLKIAVSDGAITSAASLRSLPGILSCPAIALIWMF